MQIVRELVAPVMPARMFAFVDDLAVYPTWMALVHEAQVDATADDDPPGSTAWNVELRAHVGPLARSKRLRMVRSVLAPPHRVTFERAEIDGRAHADWTLDVELTEIGPTGAEPSTKLVMTLTYGGRLWTGAVLQRVLDDEVTRGSETLTRLVNPNA